MFPLLTLVAALTAGQLDAGALNDSDAARSAREPAVSSGAVETVDGGSFSQPSTLEAQVEPRAEAADDRLTAKPTAPIAAGRLTFMVGFVDMLAVSLTVMPPKTPLELEAGASGSLASVSVYVRGGVRKWILDTRSADSAGIGIALSALAGPRYIHVTSSHLTLNLVGAADFWLWPLAKHNRFGLNVQLVLGALYGFGPLSSTPIGQVGLFPDAKLALGLGF